MVIPAIPPIPPPKHMIKYFMDGWYSVPYPLVKPPIKPLIPPIEGWITTGATVAKVDPNPLLSIQFTRNSIHEYGVSGFPFKVKWKYWKMDHFYHSGCIADINGDGEREVVFVSEDGQVYLADKDGNIIWETILPEDSWDSVTIFDIDYDGGFEILIGCLDYNLYCLDCNGEIRWSFTTGGEIALISPAIADVDKDGEVEILFGSLDGYFYCLDKEGKLKWKFFTGSPMYLNHPTVADIDKDGIVEIVFGCALDGHVYVLKPDGTLKWKRFVSQYAIGCALNDVNFDGKIEVLVLGCWPIYSIICFDCHGEVLWRFSGLYDNLSPVIAVADIDKDGVVEILFNNSFGKRLYCLTSNGSIKWEFGTIDWPCAGPILSDVDGDGKYEIGIADRDGYTYVISPFGELMQVQAVRYGAFYTGISAFDIDKDGFVESFCGYEGYPIPPGDYGGLYCFEGEK